MMRIDKCPYCGATITIGNGSKQGAIGDPFKMCSCCHKSYIEKNCYEYAVAYFYQKLIALNALGNNLAISALIAIFAGLGITKNSSFSYYGLTFLVLTVIFDSIMTLINYALKSEEINDSQKRCEDPYYVLKLGAVGLANINSEIYKEALLKLRNVPNFDVDEYYKIAKEKQRNKRNVLNLIIGSIIVIISIVLIVNITNTVKINSLYSNVETNKEKIEIYLESEDYSEAINYADECRGKAADIEGVDGEHYKYYDEILVKTVRKSVCGVWYSNTKPHKIYILTDDDSSFISFETDKDIDKNNLLKIAEKNKSEYSTQIESVSVSRGGIKGIYISIQKGGDGFSVNYNIGNDTITIKDEVFYRAK